MSIDRALIERLAREVSYSLAALMKMDGAEDVLPRFAALIAEECAKLVETANGWRGGHGYPPVLSSDELAALIRERFKP